MNVALCNFLHDCIADRVFPGCALGVMRQGNEEIIVAGRLTYDPDAPPVHPDTIYDVASITKAIPTACLALQLMEQGRVSLETRLVEYVPECTGRYLECVTLQHLLTHTLDFDFRLSDKKDLAPTGILNAIVTADLKHPPGSSYCYANATSILLGLLIERATGQRLDALAQERFFGPLGMSSTTFFPDPADMGRIAPTEIDPWRGRPIRGEVHDESAWALRPVIVAGSAGLFSTAPDLMRCIAMLLAKGVFDGTRFFAPHTVTLMYRNALSPKIGCAALGWELNAERFMGNRRTATTFGKTGFTGCTIVVDVERQTGFALVCNHTWPRRQHDKEAINRVRGALCDLVFSR